MSGSKLQVAVENIMGGNYRYCHKISVKSRELKLINIIMTGETPRDTEETGDSSEYYHEKLIEAGFEKSMAELEEAKKIMFPEGDFDLQLRMAKERIEIAQGQNRGGKPDLSPEQQSALNVEAKERQIKLERVKELAKLSSHSAD